MCRTPRAVCCWADAPIPANGPWCTASTSLARSLPTPWPREVKEETGVDVIVTDLVSVKSSRKILTYANGDNTMYMDHLFLCRPDPNGNTEPFVGDDESLEVGWFSPDALPEPLAATTVERMGYVHDYLRHKADGDAHAQFAFRGAIR